MSQQALIVEEKDVILDGSKASWEINFPGSVKGTYQGVFTFRCLLTPMQQIQADKDYRDLLGNTNPGFAQGKVNDMAFALSQLKQRVISSPPFWNDGLSAFPGSQILDSDVLNLVLEASLTAQLKFLSENEKRKEEAVANLQKTLQRKRDLDEISKKKED